MAYRAAGGPSIAAFPVVAVTFAAGDGRPAHFEELLLRTFGRAMCDDFLLPYNRKMWKRPLTGLAPAGFTWNIAPPDFEQVVRGALVADRDYRAYNARGWYPRPPPGATVRGMEVMSRALAGAVPDLRLRHRVEGIDLERGEVRVRVAGREAHLLRYREGCVSTLPLPRALALCWPVPEAMRRACAQLRWNRVVMVYLCVRGPRPRGRGHWRYYADERVVFNRLVHMHEFDPHAAPPEGWGLMAEITQRAEDPVEPAAAMAGRAQRDAERVGAIPGDCRVVASHVRVVDPAYVVFGVDSRETIDEARGYLAAHGVATLGRYGRWEYSSMAQVMRDGFELAEEVVGAAR